MLCIVKNKAVKPFLLHIEHIEHTIKREGDEMLEAAIIIGIYFFVFFLLGTIKQNNSYVDMGWGFGFVLTSVILFVSSEKTIAEIVVLLMVVTWGLRLTYHIVKRNWGRPEDYRYQKWRKDWGKHVVPIAFVRVYLVQALFMWIVGLPLWILFTTPNTIDWTVIFACIVYGIGMFFEVVGDQQLRVHIRSNRGTLMQNGLWSITRHPNYFGEACIWWGIGLYSFLLGGPLYVLVGPLVISLLLRFVSGVPLTEKHMMKKPGWENYANNTSVFTPWISKKGVLK